MSTAEPHHPTFEPPAPLATQPVPAPAVAAGPAAPAAPDAAVAHGSGRTADVAAGAGVERVGRGLVFALGSIPVGVALTLVLWQLGFIASITSFVLAYGAVWLYSRGAGHPPVRGAMGVVGVIVAGVGLSLVAVVAADATAYFGQEYPGAGFAELVDFVSYNLGRGEVWREYTTDALMYLLFAALGTFGLIRQLGRAKGA